MTLRAHHWFIAVLLATGLHLGGLGLWWHTAPPVSAGGQAEGAGIVLSLVGTGDGAAAVSTVVAGALADEALESPTPPAIEVATVADEAPSPPAPTAPPVEAVSTVSEPAPVTLADTATAQTVIAEQAVSVSDSATPSLSASVAPPPAVRASEAVPRPRPRPTPPPREVVPARAVRAVPPSKPVRQAPTAPRQSAAASPPPRQRTAPSPGGVASTAVGAAGDATRRAAPGAGPASGPPAAASGTATADLRRRYLGQLAAWLNRHKRYPRQAQRRRQEGTVRVYFKMDRQGRVLSHRIVSGSGHSLLDDEALAMLSRAGPLPAIPPELALSTLEVTVPITFSLR